MVIFSDLIRTGDAQIAQSVEQRTENPRVDGSIPSLGTIPLPKVLLKQYFPLISTVSGRTHFLLKTDLLLSLSITNFSNFVINSKVIELS